MTEDATKAAAKLLRDVEPMESAPKDGRTVTLAIQAFLNAYWDEELHMWVLNHPLHIESVHRALGWTHVEPPR